MSRWNSAFHTVEVCAGFCDILASPRSVITKMLPVPQLSWAQAGVASRLHASLQCRTLHCCWEAQQCLNLVFTQSSSL